MQRFFGLDSPLIETLTRIGDIICLSVLWLVFSLPVVTIGASNAALYAAVYRCLRQNKAGIWKNFKNAFVGNFKVATLAWIAELLALAVLSADALVFRSLWLSGETMGPLYWVALAFLAAALTWTAYVAAYTARFTGRTREVLHFGLLMLRSHPLHTLGIMAIILAGLALCLTVPVALLFAPATMCWGSTFLMERVFRCHMRPEDLERETGGLPKKN